MTEIKTNPCRRCGCEPIVVVKRHFDNTLHDILDDNFTLVCTNCGRGLMLGRKYRIDAIIAWNRRNRL